MGSGRFDRAEYTSYSKRVATHTRDQVFTSKGVKEGLDPEKIQVRESRDSQDNPEATPIMIGLDVTASMGHIAEAMAKTNLGTLVGYILDREPVVDPHLMFLGIDDATVNHRGPLQATQFEADTSIIPQLTDIWLVNGGGGNDFESYDLAWAFGAHKTVSDAWDKRKKKGYIFTIGDEMFPKQVDMTYFRKAICADVHQTITPEDVYQEACERYHVFHIIIAEGNYCRRKGSTAVLENWRQKIGKRALLLNDHTKIGELITSAMAISEGADVEAEISSWQDPTIQRILRDALT